MTNVNTVNSSEVLTEQITQLVFYESELHEILEYSTNHTAAYVEKTRELLVQVKDTLRTAYMELGATTLRDELISTTKATLSKEAREKLV